jgi:steroid delta-isomerase-like uncharacterized protein
VCKGKAATVPLDKFAVSWHTEGCEVKVTPNARKRAYRLNTVPFTQGGNPMSTEENKAVVRGYMEEVLNKGNLAAFDDYFSEDVVFNGRQGLRQELDSMFSLLRHVFPDLHLTIEDQIAEEDKVVTRVTFRGTHQGAYKSLPPTGKHVIWTGVGIDRIASGQVIEMWHWSDDLGMWEQLGAKIG